MYVETAEIFTQCRTDQSNTHGRTQEHTSTDSYKHKEFIPSRSFSGVSAVYQSLNGPVPLTVMAATWKLYWLPFSRPEETQETGCYYWLCDWNRYNVDIICILYEDSFVFCFLIIKVSYLKLPPTSIDWWFIKYDKRAFQWIKMW